MNRLWVRLAAMIAGTLFLVFFLQFATIMLDDRPRGAPDDDGPGSADHAEIAGRLVDFMLLSLVVGAAAGIAIGSVVSRPLVELGLAARRVEAGDLGIRVPLRGADELRDLAASFNRMTIALQDAERQRKNLIADISHELRTPLTVLDGSLRAALDGVSTMTEAQIAELCVRTGYLVRLVNDLRELSLAEAGALPLHPAAFDARELVDECAAILSPLAADRSIALVLEIGDLPEPRGDPLRVKQILINLLVNAIRHSRGGGRVRIVGSAAIGGVELAVVDEGDGLEPEQLAEVFDRFYRADPSRSRETGGSGLGLSIARALARAQGGELRAASGGKGKGCSFALTLPRA